MQKKSLLLAILIIVLTAGVTLGGYCVKEKFSQSPEEIEVYESVELIIAPWGKSEGQVGLVESPPVEIHGPQRFDVDKQGTFYLLDSVNRRVIRYDGNGTYISSFFIKEAAGITNDILVQSNLIYILNLPVHKVLQYTITGKFLNEYRIPNEIVLNPNPKEGTIIGLDLDSRGNIVIETADHVFHQIAYKYNYYGKQGKRGEKYYIVNNRSQCIEILGSNGIEDRKISISVTDFLDAFSLGNVDAFFCYLAGIDNMNNLYVETHLFRNKNIWKAVGKYSSEGKLLSVIPLADPKITQAFIPIHNFKQIKVSEEGDIYYLFTSPDYVKIMRYSKMQNVNWNTYINNEYGYEIESSTDLMIKHPYGKGDIRFIRKGPSVTSAGSSTCCSIVVSELSGSVVIDRQPRPIASLDLKELIMLNLRQRCKEADLETIVWTPIEIGGIEGLQASSSSDESLNKYLPWSSVVKNDLLYHIKFIKGSVSEYNQILSTFRFTR
ncbi:hypothetical protein H8E77_05775 [bacterium]|nr:hypothetical protein [bacterium]